MEEDLQKYNSLKSALHYPDSFKTENKELEHLRTLWHCLSHLLTVYRSKDTRYKFFY